VDRLILHCDLNNFYASVECLLNPALKDVPLIVAGNPDARHGVVLAKNELAKAAGIRTGDTIWEAKQKIQNLTVAAPHFESYMYFSRRAKEIYTRYTPLVEPFGADECWLDCTNCPAFLDEGALQGKRIADEIRARIKAELNLTASAGVSFCKPFAKLGSDLKKPDATTVIDRENFRKVVWPLPVGELFMAGRKTAQQLARFNIRTVGDLAAADDGVLKEHFGINGLKLKTSAAGLDTEPVREAAIDHQNKSYGHGMTTTRDITERTDLAALVHYLAERVAARMRKGGVKGRGVAVDLRSAQLSHISKQCKLPVSVRASNEIAAAALRLADQIWHGDPPLRTVTVGVFDLSFGDGGQTSMFDDKLKRADELDLAVEKIRAKYGASAILRADLIERDFIYDKTDDEDFLPFQR
jgi:DNA polymerase-4